MQVTIGVVLMSIFSEILKEEAAMKRIVYIVFFLVLVVMGLYSAEDVHKPISIHDVAMVRTWGASDITYLETRYLSFVQVRILR